MSARTTLVGSKTICGGVAACVVNLCPPAPTLFHWRFEERSAMCSIGVDVLTGRFGEIEGSDGVAT